MNEITKWSHIDTLGYMGFALSWTAKDMADDVPGGARSQIVSIHGIGLDLSEIFRFQHEKN